MKKIVIGITAPSSVVLLEGQLKYFSERGFDVYLLGPDEPRVRAFCQMEKCVLLPVDIKREISPFKDIKALFQIYSHLSYVKPDLVNLGTPKMALLGLIASRLSGIKERIYTCRGFRFEPEKGIKRVLLLNSEKLNGLLATRIICISNSVKELGIGMGLFKDGKAVVINKGSSNGIPLDRFKRETLSKEDIEQIKSRFSLRNKFVFGYVGRVVDRKGINELFRAFCVLFNQNSSLRLLVVGPVEDKQISKKRLIYEMQEHQGVIFTGVQRDVPLLMSVMDVFLLPGWGEGFGNVLIQAAAMGVPVIGTNVTGVRDAICHDFNGLRIEPRSIEKLTESMNLLYVDKELRERLGGNGPKWASNFANEIIWRGMEEIYNSSN